MAGGRREVPRSGCGCFAVLTESAQLLLVGVCSDRWFRFEIKILLVFSSAPLSQPTQVAIPGSRLCQAPEHLSKAVHP